MSMSSVEVRPARSEDREEVLAFCAQTWEWGDYIERVWDDWLQDPAGRLFVATIEQKPVGLVHVRMLTVVDAWLQGLRVAADVRGQGIAKMLNDAAVLEAMQRGATYIRLTIESNNMRSIEITEHGFWRRIGSFALYSAASLPMSERASGQDRVLVATLEDLDEIIDYLNVSNNFPLVGGVYYSGFTASPITQEILQDKIANHQLYLLRRWERLDGLAIGEVRKEGEGIRLSIGYIDGMNVEAISFIAYGLRCLLTELEVEQVRIYAPDIMLVREGLGGVEYEWDGSVFYTYERSLL